MDETARSVIRVLGNSHARRTAVLLAVLLAGVWVTTSTQGWIGSVPTHGHLFLDAAHGRGGTTRHIHHGDELDRAQEALRLVASSPTAARAQPGAGRPGDASARRVASLMSASAAQPEVTTGFFAGMLVAARGEPDRSPGLPLFAAHARRRESRTIAPPLPPPRTGASGETAT